jgi:hypothetical protein
MFFLSKKSILNCTERKFRSRGWRLRFNVHAGLGSFFKGFLGVLLTLLFRDPASNLSFFQIIYVSLCYSFVVIIDAISAQILSLLASLVSLVLLNDAACSIEPLWISSHSFNSKIYKFIITLSSAVIKTIKFLIWILFWARKMISNYSFLGIIFLFYKEK